MNKFLLCRPQGGLNDILCQIEKACRYGDITRRLVIVDTNCKNSESFCCNFSDFFVSEHQNLCLSPVLYSHLWDQLSVLPAFLAHQVNDYQAHWTKEAQNFVDVKTGQKLSFDFGKDHSEALLVHHQCGNNHLSQFVFDRIRLHDSVTDDLIQRLMCIKQPYSAIHIRNTDYKTNYKEFIDRLVGHLPGPVFVATDDAAVVDYCRKTIGVNRVVSFSELPEPNGTPLHHHFDNIEQAKKRNRDAILDLLTLGFSRNLYISKLNNDSKIVYSGFSLLAKNLQESRPRLKKMTARVHPVLDQFL